MTQPRTPAGHGGPADTPTIDWPVVLAEHGRWLRTIVFARLGQAEAVDEVMQEVSLAAVANRSPPDRSKVAPWLYRVAVIQSLLYRRKLGRKRRLTARFAERRRPTEADDREVDPLAWLLAEERRGQVRAAVARLPKPEAEILLLKYTEDWSYRDLTVHLGISRSAVEARLYRARRRLRSELTAVEAVPSES